MNIFYFVHVTGTDTGISGIPRVVRNLGRELQRRSEVGFVPVSWREDLQAIVHAEQKLLDNLSRNGGPELAQSAQALQPIEPSPGDWLLVAEASHLRGHYSGYRSVHLDQTIGFAVKSGLKVAVVFHDILPLIFGTGGELGQPFVELSPTRVRSRDDNLERLAFARYAHATALVDLVLPVSRTAGETLRSWLAQHGHRTERLPPLTPTLLPEEIFDAKRADPLSQPSSDDGVIEFVALGLVNAQKNQLSAMSAFLSLLEKRPELDLRLHVVGIVGSEVAVAASLMAKRSKGRIVLHGRLSDGQLRGLVARARATIFLSLAEGFGLPVAESLWRGKPCLCSNSGSIGEIARGGGCLAVNPRSLDAIAEGLEILACDSKRYASLLNEIAVRPLKTWSRYAEQVVGAIAAVSEGRAPEPEVDDASSSASARGERSEGEATANYEATLMVTAADLAVSVEYAAEHRARSLFYAGAINYDAKRDGAVEQDTLFFGPYVSAPAGRYAFTLVGEIDGELSLSLTAHEGRMRIVETTVSSFAEPIVFELAQPVQGFEIVGRRTPSLRSLTFRGALGELRATQAELEASLADAKAASGEPSPRVFEDNGAPLRLPVVYPAARMRVHDAFIAGNSNRLRDGAAIAFDRAQHGAIEETVLFYGPYLRLEPGRYALKFNGEIDGEIRLRFTRDFGAETLRELSVTSFDAPVVLDINRATEQFEAIANRTDDTRKLRLQSIEIALHSGEMETPAPAPRPRSRGGLLARLSRRN